MRRRDFISLLGGMTTISLVVRAQEVGKVYRIGFGPALTSPPTVVPYQAFLAQMRELGFREGQNLRIEFRGLKMIRTEILSVRKNWCARNQN